MNEAQTVIAQSLAYVSAQLSPVRLFCSWLNTRAGLLLEQESGIYSFAHLTFQEYLAAAHIHSEALEQTLVTQVENDLVARNHSALLCSWGMLLSSFLHV